MKFKGWSCTKLYIDAEFEGKNIEEAAGTKVRDLYYYDGVFAVMNETSTNEHLDSNHDLKESGG